MVCEIIEEIQASCEADPFQPLVSWINSKKKGQNHPPYVPHWDPMPLHKLCALALLWQEAGFLQEAGQLAQFLLPLESFPSLWCPEKEFNEEKILQLFSNVKKIVSISGKAPDVDLSLIETPSMSAALTLTGNGTSLGALRTKDIEIRAFGPQALPLTEQNRFGIKGKGLDGWISCFSLPEVWLKVESEIRTDCKLNLRFVGHTPDAPLAFVFYAKSQSCRIGNEIFQPKSLQRFKGQEETVHLGKTVLRSSSPHKIQVIPLAGTGCFWDTDFLIAFEIQPINPQLTFYIENS